MTPPDASSLDPLVFQTSDCFADASREGPRDPVLSRVVEFLRTIGLKVQFQSSVRGFIDHVAIRRGGLLVSPRCSVSNLLHEAGHLACVPARFRGQLSGNLETGYRRMFEALRRLELEPDSPLMRACIQCSDPEATAWAWAAGMHLRLLPEQIILDSEYQGEGAQMRLALSRRCYPGIHGLAHAGFCSNTASGRLPRFPQMAFWLQPA